MVHSQVYVVLDINSNKYKGVSIFGPSDDITEDNPNIVVIAYSFDNAVVNWMKIIGDMSFIDYYSDLEVRDNHVMIVTNSFTIEFTSSVPSKDIILWKLRYETGLIEGKLLMGSPNDDAAFDLIIFYQGMYILASVGDNFYPHPNVGSVWGTVNGTNYVGLIWISDSFSLVDIEGYPESSLSTIPMRVLPSQSGTYLTQFMFISPASKIQANGALFTQFNSANSLFSSMNCNLT